MPSSSNQRQSVALPTEIVGSSNSSTNNTPINDIAAAATKQVSDVVEQVTSADVVTDKANSAAAPEVEPEVLVDVPSYSYQVQGGDTLSAIFSQFAISQEQMYQVLDADYAVLALDTLQPGNQLHFWVEADGQLSKLEIEFDRSHQVVFSRVNNEFDVAEVRLEGDWLPRSTAIEIQGSFARSASRAGLSSAQTQEIVTMFKDKLDFRRQLRAGDKVRVLYQHQAIDGEPTGNKRLLAVEFEGRNWLHTAYLHDDGSFYDGDGNSLARAFMRHPFAQNHRISSKFNPRRKHPVTGRTKPHNGTDYAAATGTPILAAGDGVVKRVENHPIAGKYVVIQHGGEYATRYLHMSRIDVKRGQTVSRGQRIGAVGATGRVTGAHLHYEFLIRGRAVNSLTAKIPMATSVPAAEKSDFLAHVEGYQTQMQELLTAKEPAQPVHQGGGVISAVAP